MLGSYPRTRDNMESRRRRAEAVQARSAALTPEERLAKLDNGGFTATKERLKLANKIKRAQEEAKKPAKK